MLAEGVQPGGVDLPRIPTVGCCQALSHVIETRKLEYQRLAAIERQDIVDPRVLGEESPFDKHTRDENHESHERNERPLRASLQGDPPSTLVSASAHRNDAATNAFATKVFPPTLTQATPCDNATRHAPSRASRRTGIFS